MTFSVVRIKIGLEITEITLHITAGQMCSINLHQAAALQTETMMNEQPDNDQLLARYRLWFYAAAIYNLLWGSLNILFPFLFFDLIGLARPMPAAFWQVVGMFVLVYAPAYWWAARYPGRHRHLILIGFLGKLLGPIGFAWAVGKQQLPLAFGWTILSNDLMWWPAFYLYLRDAVRLYGGWWALLRGE